jgi:stage II sporulation protein M
MNLEKSKEGINLKGQFKESLNFLNKTKNYVFAAIAIFFASSISGFMNADQLANLINPLLQQILEKTINLSGFELFVFIFQNNVASAFFSLIGGIILGIFSFWALFGNGLLLGYVLNRVYIATGSVMDFWKIFPHGIFELPAIFISVGLGIRLGFFFLYADYKKEDFWSALKNSFLKTFYNCINVFFFIILPLLLIAAVIETLFIVFMG